MNLVLHLDPSLENPTSTNGVSSISNLSKNGGTLDQTTNSLRPSISSGSAINGNNTLLFDSSVLSSDTNIFNQSNDTLENFTLFAVLNVPTLSDEVFLSFGNFSLKCLSSTFYVKDGTWKSISYEGIQSNQSFMLGVEYLGSQDSINFFINSAKIASVNISDWSDDASIKVSPENLTLGSASGGEFALGEIILIDEAISPDQKLYIEGYLASKFGLFDLLPDNHVHHGTLSSSYSVSEEYKKLPKFSKDFSPSDVINEIYQWYDASEISGSNGSSISTVQDKSKNNLDLVSKNSNYVTLTVNGLDGKNTLSSSNTFLETVPNENGQTSLRLESPDSGSFAVVGLFYIDSKTTNSYQSLFAYDGDPTSSKNDFQLSLRPDTGNNMVPTLYLDGSLSYKALGGTAIAPSDKFVSNGSWNIYSVVFNHKDGSISIRIDGETVVKREDGYATYDVWISGDSLEGGNGAEVSLRLKNPAKLFSSDILLKYTSSWIYLTGDGVSTLTELLDDAGYSEDYEFTRPNANLLVLKNGIQLSFKGGRIASYLDFILFGNRGENLTVSGDLAEFISTSNTSSHSISRLEGYIAHKWGLASNLYSGHYYKTYKPIFNDSADELVDVYILSGGSNAMGNGGSQQGLTNSLQQSDADRFDSKSNNWLHLNYTQNDVLFECRYNQTEGRSDTALLRKVDPDSGGGPGNLVPGHSHRSGSRFGIEIPFLDFINHHQPNRIGLVKYALEDAYISDFDKSNSRITKLQSDPVVGDFVEILHTLDNLLTEGDIAKIFSIDSGNNKINLVEANYSNGVWSAGNEYSLEAHTNTNNSYYTFTGSDENGSFSSSDDNPEITMTLGDILTIDLSNLGSNHPLEIRDVNDVTVATENSDRLVTFTPTTASGDYYYICTSHSNMTGTINVKANSSVSFKEYALDARGCHWESKANAWDRLVKSIDGFYTSLTQNGFKVNWKGFIWAQGETEFGNTNYQSELSQLLSDIRSHVGDTKLPVKIVEAAGYASNSSGALDATNLSTFNGYLDNIADDSASNEVVEVTNHSNNAVSDSFTQDSNNQYTILRGKRIFDIGKSLAESFGSFNPSKLDGTYCWYNLKDSASRTLDGSNNLTALNNLIANNFNLSSNASFGDISFDTSSNLAHLLTSGGTDSDSTRLTAITAVDANDRDDFTIFAVLKANSVQDSNSGANHDNDGVFFVDSDSKFSIQYPYFPGFKLNVISTLDDTEYSDISSITDSESLTSNNSLHLLSVSRSTKLNSDAFTVQYQIRVNGSLIKNIYRTDTMSSGPGSRFGRQGFHIGGGLSFYLGEFAIHSGTLSDKELSSMEGYFAHNWSISHFLPASHPYHKYKPTK